MNYPKLYYALEQLAGKRQLRAQRAATLRTQAAALAEQASYAEAEACLHELIAMEGETADTCHQLARVYLAINSVQKAGDQLLRALAQDLQRAQCHYDFGVVMRRGGEPDLAGRYFHALRVPVKTPPTAGAEGSAGAWHALLDSVIDSLRQAPLMATDGITGRLRLGHLLLARQDLAGAAVAYESALAEAPDSPEVLYCLADVSRLQGSHARAGLLLARAHTLRRRYPEAIAALRDALQREVGSRAAYGTLARLCDGLRRREETIAACEEGIRLYPDEAELYWYWVKALRELGRTADALRISQQAHVRFPDHLLLLRQHGLLLPKVYGTADEVDFFRERYIAGVREILDALDSTDSGRASEAYDSIRETSFYLAYQCRDDADPQRLDGQYVQRVMSACYPQWSQLVPMPPVGCSGKIRVGYISNQLFWHPVGRMFLGWLTHHDATRFEVYVYHVSDEKDFMTDQFTRASHQFRHLPESAETVCTQVRADNLHVLVHLAVGMHPFITRLAGLRLAPIQCVAWGHPVTTGLPTIDYYLSGDLTEPPNGADHYTEQLVRLPRIGASISRPYVPKPQKQRCDYGLADDAVVYVAPHSTFKLLPQYDAVYAAIAQRVPQARFVFFPSSGEEAERIFRERLLRAFAAQELDGEKHLYFAQRQRYFQYLEILSLADVFLDAFGWSGGLTTVDALGCGLPVVTCPGALMRGRQSAAYLRCLEIEETIADSVAHYVEIAVRLGLDPAERRRVAQAIQARANRLFDDTTCVDGLEAFYRSAVAERLASPTPACRDGFE